MNQPAPASAMVPYVCWSCGKPNQYERRPGFPVATFMRCDPCAEKDGALKLTEWYEVQSAPDKLAAYRRVMAARKGAK
jgi:hypothetical protein